MLAAKKRSTRSQSRLNVRLPADVKARITRAAAILGQDLTEFTAGTLSKRADEVIESHEQILLSARDYEFFINALDKPARKPSKYSIRARDEYRRMIDKQS